MGAGTESTPELAHIEAYAKRSLRGPIYGFLLSEARITQASKGHVVARLMLSEVHMNSAASLHGSVSATIVDWMGGLAIASTDLRDKTGASIDIHVTYQSGAKLGQEVEIEGIAEKVGGSLGFTRVAIYKVENDQRGAIVISGTHTKFVKGSEPQRST